MKFKVTFRADMTSVFDDSGSIEENHVSLAVVGGNQPEEFFYENKEPTKLTHTLITLLAKHLLITAIRSSSLHGRDEVVELREAIRDLEQAFADPDIIVTKTEMKK